MVDRVAAAQAGAEEDRQQFGVRQRAGAAGEQFFAWAFGGGPVADVHGHSVSCGQAGAGIGGTEGFG